MNRWRVHWAALVAQVTALVPWRVREPVRRKMELADLAQVRRRDHEQE